MHNRLEDLQSLLGSFKYTMNFNEDTVSFSKRYGSCTVAIEPDADGYISSITLNRNGQPSVVVDTTTENIIFGRIPRESINEIVSILAQFGAARKQTKETYIISSTCSKCSSVVNSYFKVSNQILCVPCLNDK